MSSDWQSQIFETKIWRILHRIAAWDNVNNNKNVAQFKS